MPTNFVQFNPLASGQESDASYLADSMRANGAAANAILPHIMFNKMMYQLSTYITAQAQALVTKGYAPNDGAGNPGTAVTTLAAVMANIMTQADMAPWAKLASPSFSGTPTAPTPPSTDNSTRIATMAAVNSLLKAGAVFNGGLPGYFVFPAALGGMIIQWARGNPNANTINVPFPLTFPHACIITLATTSIGTQTFTVNPSGNTSWLLTGNGFYWLLAIGY